MTPLEAMAKAYNAERFGHHGADIWEGAPPIARERAVDGMRAALLALAESELPLDAIKAAGDAVQPEDATRFLEILFRTVLHSIAEGDMGCQADGEEKGEAVSAQAPLHPSAEGMHSFIRIGSFETVAMMARRHKRERIDLFVKAIAATGSVNKAAKLVGADRGAIYRELREFGIPPNAQRQFEERSDTARLSK